MGGAAQFFHVVLVHMLRAALSVPQSREQSVPAGSNTGKDRKPFSSQLHNALIQEPELAGDEPTVSVLFPFFYFLHLNFNFELFKQIS